MLGRIKITICDSLVIIIYLHGNNYLLTNQCKLLNFIINLQSSCDLVPSCVFGLVINLTFVIVINFVPFVVCLLLAPI